MNYSEIEVMDQHQLKSKINELQKQLGELQLKKSIAVATVKDSSVFKKLRRSIAQMKFKLHTYA